MKKRIWAVIAAAAMLSACSEEKIPEETDMRQTEPIAVTEITAARAEEPEETDSLDYEEAAAAEDNEGGNNEGYDPDRHTIPLFDSRLRMTDLSEYAADGGDRSYAVRACGGDNICVSYLDKEQRNVEYVCVIDLKNNKLIDRIESPYEYSFCDISYPAEGENVSVTFMETDGTMETGRRETLVINRDGGHYALPAGEEYLSERYVCGEHTVYNSDGNIIDENGNVLIERYDEEGDRDSFYSIAYAHMLPLDSERFIYRKIGYESIPGFGIYDFTEGAAKDVPDSKDKCVIGVYGGKIYSCETVWDGFGTKLYVTDPDTLETSFLCDTPFEITEDDVNSYVTYTMPDNCGYICAFFCGYDKTDFDSQYYRMALLDRENGEKMFEYNINVVELYCSRVFLTDSFICMPDDSASDTMVYAELPPKGVFYTETVSEDGERGYSVLYASDSDRLSTLMGVSSRGELLSWNDKEHMYEPFENIMGYDGIIIRTKYDGTHWSESSYFADIDGKLYEIGYCFGTGFGEQAADIDGDGVTELVCNCVYGADGARDCIIYKRTENGISQASGADLLDSDIIDMTAPANTIGSEYSYEENKMICGCVLKETGEYGKFVFDIDMDKLNFEPYRDIP